MIKYAKQLIVTLALIVLTIVVAQSQMQRPNSEENQKAEPTIAMPKVQSQIQAVHASQNLKKYFAVATQASASSSINEAWQLSGIITIGKQRYALIKQHNKTTRYKAGETLPDHSVITKINTTGINIKTDSATSLHLLYQDAAP